METLGYYGKEGRRKRPVLWKQRLDQHNGPGKRRPRTLRQKSSNDIFTSRRPLIAGDLHCNSRACAAIESVPSFYCPMICCKLLRFMYCRANIGVNTKLSRFKLLRWLLQDEIPLLPGQVPHKLFPDIRCSAGWKPKQREQRDPRASAKGVVRKQKGAR